MFRAKAIVHLSKRHVIRPPPGGSGIRELAFFPFGNSGKRFRSGFGKRRNIVREFGKIEIFVREFVKMIFSGFFGSGIRGFENSCEIREFGKMKKIVREFGNRPPLRGASFSRI